MQTVLQLILGTDKNSGMRKIAQLSAGYLWFLLLVLFLVPPIALAQSPEQIATLAEAKQLHEEAAALYCAGKFSHAEDSIHASLNCGLG